MKNLLTMIAFLCPFAIFGQIKGKHFEMINKNTKQWLSWTGSSVGKNSYEHFILISKDNYKKIRIDIPYKKTDQFIDSLKKNGWKEKVKRISGDDKYKPSIELSNITFLKINDKSDSLFQFVYKISLTDLKSNTIQYQTDTLLGTEKEKVISAFANKQYKFDETIIQKVTGIIKTGLYSEGLILTFKKEYYKYVFPPWTSYYF